MNKTILLVEDDAVTSKVVSSMLEKNGYIAIPAYSGLEAVAVAHSNENISLILMDIDLGDGFDGTEAAKQILALKSVPIVFHTSHSEKDYVDRVKEITRYGYVIKNSGNFVLLSSIEMAFELYGAHKNLQESEEKYRLVFDHSPLGLVHFDEKGVINTCNDVFVGIIGSSYKALIGLDMFKLPDDKLKEEIQISLNGDIGHYEGVYKSVTAEKFTPVKIVFASLKSHDGHVLGGVGVVEDVTEQKKSMDLLKKNKEELERMNEELTATNEEFEAMNEELTATNEEFEAMNEELIANSEDLMTKEKALLRENNFIEAVLESIPGLFYVYDDLGNLVRWNRKHGEMTGYSGEELSHMTLEKFFEGDEAVKAAAAFREILSEGYGEFEAQLLTKNKGKPLILFDGVRLIVEEKKYLIGVGIDITERKQAADILASEKERLSVTLRSIGEGVITTDINGRVKIMNRVAEELTGWNQNDAIDKSVDEVFNIIDDITRKPQVNPILKALQAGKFDESSNHTLLVSRNGTERIILESGSPIKDRNSNTIGMVMVFRDITEKRRIEETVQNAQKLESLGVLAGGIAHDFNNLLGGIFGSIELAQLKNKDSGLTKYFDGALSSIERARSLTRQLLTFSRGGTPVMKPGSLSPFIQDAVQFALSGSNVSSKFNIPGDLPNCFFDINQMEQVIGNIVLNAQESMPMGGVIGVYAENLFLKEQDHALLPAGNYVKISIRDNGVGIPKDVIPFIFDPFFSTKEKGHGLGLATCYSIINRHGGAIDVDSAQGEGSTFHIFLPVSNELESAVAEVSVVSHRGCGRILVMDDEEIMLSVISDMLTELGYSVVTMRDGIGVIDYFIQERKLLHEFSAMIFDLTVPGGVGGIEVIEEMRKIDLSIPVFVSSGYSEDPAMAHPQEFGFTASIRKPFQIRELSEMLENYVAKKKR